MKIRRRIVLASDARKLKKLRDRCVPAPVMGTHIGGGKHVNMPESWDGKGEVPPGWSGYSGVLEEFDFSDYEKTAPSVGYRVDMPRDLLEFIERNPDKFTDEERLLLETQFALCDEPGEDGDPKPPRPKTESDVARELKRIEREAGK